MQKPTFSCTKFLQNKKMTLCVCAKGDASHHSKQKRTNTAIIRRTRKMHVHTQTRPKKMYKGKYTPYVNT